MLNDDDILFKWAGTRGIALCWVIDQHVLYDYPLSVEHSKIFLEADEVIDISDQYPDHNGITVRLIKNGEILEELQTSEYFGSILLSNPLVIDMDKYPYGKYAIAPDALFDGEKFILTDGRDMSTLSDKVGWE